MNSLKEKLIINKIKQNYISKILHNKNWNPIPKNLPDTETYLNNILHYYLKAKVNLDQHYPKVNMTMSW